MREMLSQFWNWAFIGKAGAWTAASTCALVVFSGLLWEVSRDANRASQATQRAYLSILFSPKIELLVAGGKITGYKIHGGWINNGTTPTQTAVAEFNIADSPDRPQQGTDFSRLPQSERQEYVVGPKSSWEVTPVPLSFAEALDAAATSSKHVFAWGWVVYRDIYKDTPPRLSEFCFELTNAKWNDSDHTKPSAGITIETPPCQIHNCYDEHCADYAKLAQEAK